jgi:anaerobic magnesium-protoporphyrin IX monomethyl ester cyclase
MSEVSCDGGVRTRKRLAEGSRRCRVALLWPRGHDPAATTPLALGYLKANLPEQRFDVRLFDCALDRLDASSPRLRVDLREFAPHVVGVSSWSPMFPEALALLKLARELDPEAVTLLGGAHASAWPERCLDHDEVDYVFVGEAERSLPVLLDGLRSGRPDLRRVAGLVWQEQDGEIRRNESDLIPDLDSLPLPDYVATRLDEYNAAGYRWNSPPVPSAPLWLTRGCPYRCQYCSTPALNGRPIRKHSVEQVLRQVRRLYGEHGVRWFNIIDDNFTYDLRWAKRVCRALIDLDLPGARFATPNGVRMQRGDPELWSLMKQAGWEYLVVAPESGSPRTLARMKKDLDLDRVPGIVREIKAAGLRCQAFFIIGYPGDTRDDLRLTRELILRCRFNWVFLAHFQPLPGTPVYAELVETGELEDGELPFNASDGKRIYTPEGLRDCNLSGWIGATQALTALTDPGNLPYQLSVLFHRYKPGFVLRKIGMTAWSALRPGEQGRGARYDGQGRR